MNQVIHEFLRELEGKMGHKFQPFLFDPSAQDYYWDYKNFYLSYNPPTTNETMYCVADGGSQLRAFMQHNYQLYRKFEF